MRPRLDDWDILEWKLEEDLKGANEELIVYESEGNLLFEYEIHKRIEFIELAQSLVKELKK